MSAVAPVCHTRRCASRSHGAIPTVMHRLNYRVPPQPREGGSCFCRRRCERRVRKGAAAVRRHYRRAQPLPPCDDFSSTVAREGRGRGWECVARPMREGIEGAAMACEAAALRQNFRLSTAA
uniref:Uncharacterized protein n=1 Tax=Oryza sativa subsp. japonica TaxID=39947 RepID=Q6ZI25_ORYSJ|nr:hypothetical protein [Oryza sativa Japonica Group]